MTHNQQFGTCIQERGSSDGFHQDTTLGSISHGVIILGQGSLTYPFHNRKGIFEPVTESTGCGINNYFVKGNTQVIEQNIELLGQIDVNRAVGYNS